MGTCRVLIWLTWFREHLTTHFHAESRSVSLLLTRTAFVVPEHGCNGLKHESSPVKPITSSCAFDIANRLGGQEEIKRHYSR